MTIITAKDRLNLNVIHANGGESSASFPAKTPLQIEFAMLREMTKWLPVWPTTTTHPRVAEHLKALQDAGSL